ncbi:MAG TPA: thiamine pyrophosphate-binding protein [Candidatus Woesearchaeota archaeon]|nr:thiamine pyrophosphate-binding protein [Candidatus Woesearchaeota archaeon]
MKLSDYVADFLESHNVRDVFGITGGAIVHVFDSIAKNPKIRYICTEHEQAAAMAADAYSRISRNIGVAIATSGPGATNLVTGVCCSYFDSIPLLLITGQVPRSQLKKDSKSRQIGFQETDIVSMFSNITKYSVLVESPERIRYELEKAFFLARSGRPGPVLLDIPDDVQRAEVDPHKLQGFVEEPEMVDEVKLVKDVERVINLLETSERPVVILGNGIKLAQCEEKAINLIEKLGTPVALTWATKDLLPFNHPQVIEGFGVSSERAGNFVVQNSDLIISFGSRLDTHETGNNQSTFARGAKKVIIDIDDSELKKFKERGMKDIYLINSDVRLFLQALLQKQISMKDMSKWFVFINNLKEKYPICPSEYLEQKEYVNPYVFMAELSEQSKENDIIITDAGANLTWTMQGYRVKKGQTLFSAFNHSPMGYALPASIGAVFASRKDIICIIGDGGIQMNIQELATLAYHKLPIKIFLFNNSGYGIIQQTQDTWLNSRYVASNPDSSVAIPDLERIAQAYGITTIRINNHSEMKDGIKYVLGYKGPILCNVSIEQHQKIIPKLEFGRPLEDSSPLLDRKEFNENMIIDK